MIKHLSNKTTDGELISVNKHNFQLTFLDGFIVDFLVTIRSFNFITEQFIRIKKIGFHIIKFDKSTYEVHHVKEETKTTV